MAFVQPKCNVCLNDMGQQEASIAVLSCSHHLCSKCLKPACIEQMVVCPLCWETTALPLNSSNDGLVGHENSISSCSSAKPEVRDISLSKVIDDNKIPRTFGEGEESQCSVQDSEEDNFTHTQLKETSFQRTSCTSQIQSENVVLSKDNAMIVALEIASKNLKSKLLKERAAAEEIKSLVQIKNLKAEYEDKTPEVNNTPYEISTEKINSIEKKTVCDDFIRKPLQKSITILSRWSRHLSVSVPNNGEILPKFSYDRQPMQNLRGIISSVQNPYRIHVQVLDEELHRLKFMNNELQLEFNHISERDLSTTSVRKPDQGQAYAILFQNIWQRALVTKICGDDFVQVHCLDTGRCGIVGNLYLQPLPERFFELRAQAVSCQLYGIYRLEIKNRSERAFFSYWPADVMSLLQTKENKIVKLFVHTNGLPRENRKATQKEFYFVVNMKVETEFQSINHQVNNIFMNIDWNKQDNMSSCKEIVLKSCIGGGDHATNKIPPKKLDIQPISLVNGNYEPTDVSSTKHSNSEKETTDLKNGSFYDVLKTLQAPCNTFEAGKISSSTRNGHMMSEIKLTANKNWYFPEPKNTLTPCFRGILTWVDDNGGFYVHDTKWSKQLIAIRDTLANYTTSPSFASDSIVDGNACLAKYHGNWYRAMIKALNKETSIATVLFIDFGSTKNVGYGDIRLDLELQEIPVETFRCSLYNLKPLGANPCEDNNIIWPKSLIDFLHSVALNQEFNVIVKSYFPLNISLRFPSNSECLTDFLVAACKADYIHKV